MESPKVPVRLVIIPAYDGGSTKAYKPSFTCLSNVTVYNKENNLTNEP